MTRRLDYEDQIAGARGCGVALILTFVIAVALTIVGLGML